MPKYLKIAPDPDARVCHCGDGNPDCDHWESCDGCGMDYRKHEGHDCIDGVPVQDLRVHAKELRDALDACETERDRLRAQIAALQSVPQGVEVEVPRWEDVDAKFQAGEPRNPLDDFVHSNEPAIDDEDGTCADEVFRAELKAAIDWVTARLVPTPIKPLQPEERRMGPDEVAVSREEWEALNAFLEDWRDPESRSLHDWNTSLKAKAARINALRTSAQAPGQRGEG